MEKNFNQSSQHQYWRIRNGNGNGFKNGNSAREANKFKNRYIYGYQNSIRRGNGFQNQRNSILNDLTPEQEAELIQLLENKHYEQEINKRVQTELEVNRRIKEHYKSHEEEENDQMEILEKELSHTKKEISKLKHENETLKEESEKWKRKYKTLLSKSKDETSSEEEEEETPSMEELKEELGKLLNDDTITTGKIKKLGRKTIQELCEKYKIIYKNMDEASKLIFNSIPN